MSSDVYRQHLQERLQQCHVPAHLHGGLLDYLTARHPPGAFLTAVLANNLREAIRRADPESRALIAEIVTFLWWFAPADSWGSVETMAAWVTDPRPVLEVFE